VLAGVVLSNWGRNSPRLNFVFPRIPPNHSYYELPEQELITLINPEIVEREGERIVQEGCLSIPGYFGKIKRAVTVKVKAQDRYGKEFHLKAEGLLAQALKQEIEHLDGILHIDHLESRDKLFESLPT
jgi:peptide deformylase